MKGYYAGCGDLFCALTTASYMAMQDSMVSRPQLIGDLLEISVDSMRKVAACRADRCYCQCSS